MFCLKLSCQHKPTSHSLGVSGLALHQDPSTTSMGGSSWCKPLAMTDLAVPLRPAMAMPPRPAFAEACRLTICPVHVCLGVCSDLLSVRNRIEHNEGRLCENKRQEAGQIWTCVNCSQKQGFFDGILPNDSCQRVGSRKTCAVVALFSSILFVLQGCCCQGGCMQRS